MSKITTNIKQTTPTHQTERRQTSTEVVISLPNVPLGTPLTVNDSQHKTQQTKKTYMGGNRRKEEAKIPFSRFRERLIFSISSFPIDLFFTASANSSYCWIRPQLSSYFLRPIQTFVSRILIWGKREREWRKKIGTVGLMVIPPWGFHANLFWCFGGPLPLIFETLTCDTFQWLLWSLERVFDSNFTRVSFHSFRLCHSSLVKAFC